MDAKDKEPGKRLVTMWAEEDDIKIIDRAAAKENRSRTSYIINASKERANKILAKGGAA